MSSSRVFKDDPAFTPVSLISENHSSPTPATKQPEVEQDPVEEELTQPAEVTPPVPAEQSSEPEEVSSPPPPVPDLEAVRTEAYEQGVLETEQKLQQKLSRTVEAFSHACQEIDNQHEALLEQSRSDIINLVIALSKKIIGMELTTGRDVIVETLQNAIELAIKHNEYDIWINPEDLSTVEEMVPELISSVQKLEHITLKTDPEITPGGCRLDSSVCSVDATIEAQLETIRDFLDEKSPECSTPESHENPDSPDFSSSPDEKP